MSKEQYFEMCDALGTEPKEDEIPIEVTDFPPQVQEVIKVFNHLPDRWDSLSGTYFGKDYSILPFLIKVFGVEDVETMFLVLTIAESSLSEIYSNEIKMKRKAKEKAKPSTPNNTRRR
jgi:hypothetical protein